jgi:hypothetical protein
MPNVKHHFNQHRQHGMEPISKGDKAWRRFVVISMMIMGILYLYGIAHTWDERAEAEDRIIQVQLRQLAERGDIERKALQRVADAYAQGQRDALRGMSDQQSAEFAQACRLRSRNAELLRPNFATTRNGG